MKNMDEQNQKGPKPSLLLNYCAIIASIVVILAGLHAASSVLGPFLMAAFFAVLMISPVNWLQKRLNFAPWLALTVVVIGVLVIGGGAATLIGSQIAQFARDIPEYRHRFITTLENYNLDLGDVIPFLKEEPGEQPADPEQGVDDGTEETEEEIQKNDEESAAEPEFAPTPERNASEKRKFRRAHDVAQTRETPRHEYASLDERVAAQTLDADPEPVPPLDLETDASPVVETEQDPFAATDETLAEETPSVGVSNAGSNKFADADVALDPANRLMPPKTPEILKDGGLFSEDPNSGYEDEEDPESDEEPDELNPRNPAFNAVKLSSQQLFRFIGGLAGELSYFASTALIITLLLVFMLIETAKIPRKLVAALGEREFTNTHILKVVEDIRHYMAIKTQMSLLVGVAVTLLTIASKVQYPLLWGFVAFLLNYIPNIGSVAAAIPPVVLATVEHGLFTGCVDAVFFALINCGIGYVLEPKLLGQGLDLSPLIVLIALIFFGWLLGPVGMFLSPPLAVIMKIIFQSFPETKWIAALMSNTAPLEDEDDESDTEPVDTTIG